MTKSTNRGIEGLSVRAVCAVLTVALFASGAGSSSSSLNQVRDVKIAEQSGKTVVTVTGSARPSFTAFKLSSPKRLVVDLANTQIRGVPSVIDSKTDLVNGVAVSEYWSNGLPVSRLMINFKSDAAYRVKVVGENLMVTLSGSPSENTDPEPETEMGKASANEVALALAEAEEARRLRDERRAELDRMELESATLKAEMERAKLEAERAKQEAEQAKEKVGLEVERLTKAKEEARRERTNESLQTSRVSRMIDRYRFEIETANALAQKEKEKREQLEQKLTVLNAKIEESMKAADKAEKEREQAQAEAESFKKDAVKSAELVRLAERETAGALAAQRDAAEKYRKAAEGEKEEMLRVLKERTRQAVDAEARQKEVEQSRRAAERKLEQAIEELARATSESRRAASSHDKTKLDIERKLKEAENGRREAERVAKLSKSRAEEASIAKKKAEQELQQIRSEAERSKTEAQKLADEKIASATEKLEQAQKDREAAEAKIAEAETRLSKSEDALKAAQAKAEKSEKRAVDLEAELNKAKTAIDEPKSEEEPAKEEAVVQAKINDASIKEKGEGESKDKTAKATQEEMRLKRLAEMRTARSEQVEKKESEKGAADPIVEDIQFKQEGDLQKVVIRANLPLEYTTASSDAGVISMSITKAGLSANLERTLDVTDFGGVVTKVSSYSEGGSVRVDVNVGRTVSNEVKRKENTIEWVFASENQKKDDVDPPIETKPLGTVSRTVAKEDERTYAYPHERTAGYTLGVYSEGAKKKHYRGRHVDLDFKDADIHNILRLLADVGMVNIITADDVQGSVTIRMRDVAWDHALDVILQSKQLGMVQEGNLIRVAPQSVLEKEREMEIARRKQSIALEPLETRLIPVSYATAQELQPRASDLLTDRGKLSVDTRTNVIIARDTKSVLNQIEALVRNLDTQTPQVLIEGRIVEATSTYAREVGIQWGGDFSATAATGNPTGLAFPSSMTVAGGATDSQTPMTGLSPVPSGQPNPNFAVNMPSPAGTGEGGALGITLGSIANNANLSLRLSAMEEEGTLRILSSPKILTLDNRQATIEQGTSIPFSQVSAQGVQTSFQEAKLTMAVTPHVTADGSILLKMILTRDEPDFNNRGARGDPTILKRRAETELLVSDGHTAVIGGIYTRNTGMAFKKVPFLAEIPIIGWLFKKKNTSDRRSEMLIFITPRIVNRAESIGQ